MAASELRAELKYRDGHTKEFTMKTEGNLTSVIASLNKLSSNVSEVLTDLIQQEKCLTGNGQRNIPADDEEEDDDSDEDGKETETPPQIDKEPPTKRQKTLRS